MGQTLNVETAREHAMCHLSGFQVHWARRGGAQAKARDLASGEADLPTVSVVIPTYNCSKLVGDAIRSVLAQTYGDLELLVIDDGSTDDTCLVVSEFTDPRIRYVRQQNLGLPAARNEGIRRAKGAYVGFLDSDDWWLPNKLELQMRLLDQDREIGLVFGGYRLVDEAGSLLATRLAIATGPRFAQQLLRSNIVSGSASTSLVRMSVFDRVGLFDESLPAAEDWNMWLRIGMISKFASVEDPVACIRWRANSMSSGSKRMEQGIFAAAESFLKDPVASELFTGRRSTLISGAHFQAGTFFLRSGCRVEAASHFARSALHSPFWLDPYILLIRTLFRTDRFNETRKCKS